MVHFMKHWPVDKVEEVEDAVRNRVSRCLFFWFLHMLTVRPILFSSLWSTTTRKPAKHSLRPHVSARQYTPPQNLAGTGMSMILTHPTTKIANKPSVKVMLT